MSKEKQDVKKDSPLDLSESSSELGIEVVTHGAKTRKSLAYFVLGFIAIFLIVTVFMYYFAAEPGKIRLETAKDIYQNTSNLLPFGTLVLGYFFGAQIHQH